MASEGIHGALWLPRPGTAYFMLHVMSYKVRAMSYELQVTSYKLRVTSYELQVTSYKLRVTRHDIQARSFFDPWDMQ